METKDEWEGWEISEEHPGYRVKVVQHDYGFSRVYRPILTDEERKKREERARRMIEAAFREYYREMERKKYEQQNNN